MYLKVTDCKPRCKSSIIGKICRAMQVFEFKCDDYEIMIPPKEDKYSSGKRRLFL